jgi:hypothetical protein
MSSNLRWFPPPTLEPVSLEDLRRNTRLLLEVQNIERQIEKRMKTLTDKSARLKKLKIEIKTERKSLLERIARGAEVA